MPAVRSATLADADAVFALSLRFATSFVPERAAFDWSLVRIIGAHDARLLVVDDSEVVGYLLGFIHDTFFANGPVAWVEEVMVREDRTREGLGTRLIDSFESAARDAGAELVGLATRRAADFYLALGYEDSATYFRKDLGSEN